MNTYEGMDVLYSSTTLNLSNRWKTVSSFTLQSPYIQQHPVDRTLGSPQNLSGRYEEKIFARDGIRTPAPHPVNILLLEWLYSPCGPSPLFQFPDLIYSQSAGLL
jgi:hypothetical protein